MKFASLLVATVLAVLTIVFSQVANRQNPSVQFRNSHDIKSPPGFSHAAVVTGGKLVFISGQVGRKGGEMVGDDFGAQADQAFMNLKAVLTTAGATPRDLVKVNYYVVGLNAERLATLREVRGKFIDKTRPPTSTVAGVQALAQEGALIEIEAVAVIP